jgi:Flp pilus assembly protein TadD
MGILSRDEGEVLSRIIAERFPQGGVIEAVSSSWSGGTEQDHLAQIEDKPNDPNVYNNYGAYLNRRGDKSAAELQFKKALALDPQHQLALGNLANLTVLQEEYDEAEGLYRRAMVGERIDPFVRSNYARFLNEIRGDSGAADLVVREGLKENPSHTQLLRVGIDVALARRDPAAALDRAQMARREIAGDPYIERAYATALQLTGGAPADCIAAYRLALVVNRNDANVLLNLAQLLFAIGADSEARGRLQEAERAGLEPTAQLEASFYWYAHTGASELDVIRRMERLLLEGARTTWDFGPNIARIATERPGRESVLRDLSSAMAGRIPWKPLLVVLRNSSSS